MLALLLIAQQVQGPTGSTDFFTQVVGYGVAAPLILFMAWIIRQRDSTLKERDTELRDEREKTQQLNERLLEQQKELIPLVSQMTEVLKNAADTMATDKNRE